MKSRYIFCPMTERKIGRRVTLIESIRRRYLRWKKRYDEPDVYPVTGYFRPVYPGK